MPVVISMLRGVNVGAHNRLKMEPLRALYQSLKLHDAETYVQSGNVIFKTEQKNLARLAAQIQSRIERTFGFKPEVILRTASEVRSVIARNPFAKRSGIEPNRLLVTFLASEPSIDLREKLLAIKIEPEELRVDGRELYVYFPNGMGRAKFSGATVERILKIAGTGRNWNSVTKMLEIAERMENAI